MMDKRNHLFRSGIVVPLVVAAVVAAVGALITERITIAKLDAKTETLTKYVDKVDDRIQECIKEISDVRVQLEGLKGTSGSVGLSSSDSATQNPEQLIAVIRAQQGLHVKESFGTEAYQCFTDNDLATFQTQRVPAAIVASLKEDAKFAEIVLAIRKLSRSERQMLLDRANSTYKPTWSELGRESREGQTGAGQKAEKMIANSVTALVNEMLRLSDEEFDRQYLR